MIPESENIQLHVKDPGLKKMLTNRLASLLKELDNEEVNKDLKPETTTVESFKNFERLLTRESVKDGIRKEDLLHLAMHNILLQGMIGHMDLNEVYKKVHILVNSFNNVSGDNEGSCYLNIKYLQFFVFTKTITKIQSHTNFIIDKNHAELFLQFQEYLSLK